MIRLDEDSRVYFNCIIIAFEIYKRTLSILITEIFELLKTRPNFFFMLPAQDISELVIKFLTNQKLSKQYKNMIFLNSNRMMSY
jgi:hypothetical protein